MASSRPAAPAVRTLDVPRGVEAVQLSCRRCWSSGLEAIMLQRPGVALPREVFCPGCGERRSLAPPAARTA